MSIASSLPRAGFPTLQNGPTGQPQHTGQPLGATETPNSMHRLPPAFIPQPTSVDPLAVNVAARTGPPAQQADIVALLSALPQRAGDLLQCATFDDLVNLIAQLGMPETTAVLEQMGRLRSHPIAQRLALLLLFSNNLPPGCAQQLVPALPDQWPSELRHLHEPCVARWTQISSGANSDLGGIAEVVLNSYAAGGPLTMPGDVADPSAESEQALIEQAVLAALPARSRRLRHSFDALVGDVLANPGAGEEHYLQSCAETLAADGNRKAAELAAILTVLARPLRFHAGRDLISMLPAELPASLEHVRGDLVAYASMHPGVRVWREVVKRYAHVTASAQAQAVVLTDTRAEMQERGAESGAALSLPLEPSAGIASSSSAEPLTNPVADRSSASEQALIDQAVFAALPKKLRRKYGSFNAFVTGSLADRGFGQEMALRHCAETLADSGNKKASELAAILLVLMRPRVFGKARSFILLLPAEWPASLEHLRVDLVGWAMTRLNSKVCREIVRRYASATASVQPQAAVRPPTRAGRRADRSRASEQALIEQAVLAEIPERWRGSCKSFDVLIAYVLANSERDQEHALQECAETLAAIGNKKASEMAAILVVLKRPRMFKDSELFISLLPAKWPARLEHLRKDLIEYTLKRRCSAVCDEVIKRYAGVTASTQAQATAVPVLDPSAGIVGLRGAESLSEPVAERSAESEQALVERAVLAAIPKRLRRRCESFDDLLDHVVANRGRESEHALHRAAVRLAAVGCKSASELAAILVVLANPQRIRDGKEFILLLPTELPARLAHLRGDIIELAMEHPYSNAYREVVMRYAHATSRVQEQTAVLPDTHAGMQERSGVRQGSGANAQRQSDAEQGTGPITPPQALNPSTAIAEPQGTEPPANPVDTARRKLDAPFEVQAQARSLQHAFNNGWRNWLRLRGRTLLLKWRLPGKEAWQSQELQRIEALRAPDGHAMRAWSLSPDQLDASMPALKQHLDLAIVYKERIPVDFAGVRIDINHYTALILVDGMHFELESRGDDELSRMRHVEDLKTYFAQLGEGGARIATRGDPNHPLMPYLQAIFSGPSGAASATRRGAVLGEEDSVEDDESQGSADVLGSVDAHMQDADTGSNAVMTRPASLASSVGSSTDASMALLQELNRNKRLQVIFRGAQTVDALVNRAKGLRPRSGHADAGPATLIAHEMISLAVDLRRAGNGRAAEELAVLYLLTLAPPPGDERTILLQLLLPEGWPHALEPWREECVAQWRSRAGRPGLDTTVQCVIELYATDNSAHASTNTLLGRVCDSLGGFIREPHVEQLASSQAVDTLDAHVVAEFCNRHGYRAEAATFSLNADKSSGTEALVQWLDGFEGAVSAVLWTGTGSVVAAAHRDGDSGAWRPVDQGRFDLAGDPERHGSKVQAVLLWPADTPMHDVGAASTTLEDPPPPRLPPSDPVSAALEKLHAPSPVRKDTAPDAQDYLTEDEEPQNPPATTNADGPQGEDTAPHDEDLFDRVRASLEYFIAESASQLASSMAAAPLSAQDVAAFCTQLGHRAEAATLTLEPGQADQILTWLNGFASSKGAVLWTGRGSMVTAALHDDNGWSSIDAAREEALGKWLEDALEADVDQAGPRAEVRAVVFLSTDGDMRDVSAPSTDADPQDTQLTVDPAAKRAALLEVELFRQVCASLRHFIPVEDVEHLASHLAFSPEAARQLDAHTVAAFCNERGHRAVTVTMPLDPNDEDRAATIVTWLESFESHGRGVVLWTGIGSMVMATRRSDSGSWSPIDSPGESLETWLWTEVVVDVGPVSRRPEVQAVLFLSTESQTQDVDAQSTTVQAPQDDVPLADAAAAARAKLDAPFERQAQARCLQHAFNNGWRNWMRLRGHTIEECWSFGFELSPKEAWSPQELSRIDGIVTPDGFPMKRWILRPDELAALMPLLRRDLDLAIVYKGPLDVTYTAGKAPGSKHYTALIRVDGMHFELESMGGDESTQKRPIEDLAAYFANLGHAGVWLATPGHTDHPLAPYVALLDVEIFRRTCQALGAYMSPPPIQPLAYAVGLDANVARHLNADAVVDLCVQFGLAARALTMPLDPHDPDRASGILAWLDQITFGSDRPSAILWTGTNPMVGTVVRDPNIGWFFADSEELLGDRLAAQEEAFAQVSDPADRAQRRCMVRAIVFGPAGADTRTNENVQVLPANVGPDPALFFWTTDTGAPDVEALMLNTDLPETSADQTTADPVLAAQASQSIPVQPPSVFQPATRLDSHRRVRRNKLKARTRARSVGTGRSAMSGQAAVEEAVLAELARCKGSWKIHESFDDLVATVLAHRGRQREFALQNCAEGLAASNNKEASELTAILVILACPDNIRDPKFFITLLPDKWPARLKQWRSDCVAIAKRRRSPVHREIVRRYGSRGAVNAGALNPGSTTTTTTASNNQESAPGLLQEELFQRVGASLKVFIPGQVEHLSAHLNHGQPTARPLDAHSVAAFCNMFRFVLGFRAEVHSKDVAPDDPDRATKIVEWLDSLEIAPWLDSLESAGAVLWIGSMVTAVLRDIFGTWSSIDDPNVPLQTWPSLQPSSTPVPNADQAVPHPRVQAVVFKPIGGQGVDFHPEVTH